MAIGLSPPTGYRTPSFPSLNVHELKDTTSDRHFTLYHLSDVWHFTVLWTLLMYLAFHVGAVGIAIFTHAWNKRTWKILWVVPLVYLIVASLEAFLAGSIVGVIVGAVYRAGYYEMNTWIPAVWGFICVLVLIISSFTIQGGL